jgi:hypothetical protein
MKWQENKNRKKDEERRKTRKERTEQVRGV